MGQLNYYTENMPEYVPEPSYGQRQAARMIADRKAGTLDDLEVISTDDIREHGACADRGASYPFFPRESDLKLDAKNRPREDTEAKRKREAAARAICSSCDIMIDCRVWSIVNNVPGFAGGLNETDRKSYGNRRGIRPRRRSSRR